VESWWEGEQIAGSRGEKGIREKGSSAIAAEPLLIFTEDGEGEVKGGRTTQLNMGRN